MTTIISQLGSTSRPHPEKQPLEVGEWYWARDEDDEDGVAPRLMCITHIGSNYAKLEGQFDQPEETSHWRIHLDEFDQHCRHEPNWRDFIHDKIGHHRQLANKLMGDVKRLTERLGVARIGVQEQETDDSTRALIIVGVHDPDEYKGQLIDAKEALPQIFKEIEFENAMMAAWMRVEMLPLQAESEKMKGSIGAIDDRIFNVELYAGLCETIKQVRKGRPAPVTEPLHLMQGRCYMDEECIAGYEIGGICCESLAQFDRWLRKSKHFERIFPFQRCMVQFQVRRNRKNRRAESLYQTFVNIELGDADKWTFMYIRNGKQLWRLHTEVEFGPKMFPGKAEFDMTSAGGTWARIDGWENRHSGIPIITDADFQDRCERHAVAVAEWKGFQKEHNIDSPYGLCFDDKKKHLEHEAYTLYRAYENFDPEKWVHVDPDTVYHDDIMASIAKTARDYNRIALVIQGVLDRSEVLHPHPRISLGKPDDFANFIKLVYDSDRTLSDGEEPNFEELQSRLAASIKPGTVVYGQQLCYEHEQAAIEEAYRRANWRYDSGQRTVTRFLPRGDPGPGKLAEVARFRKGRAIFNWKRLKRTRSTYYELSGEILNARCSVAVKNLFNMTDYVPGTFRKFYSDPRTRAKYLKWAHILLLAEEYHAGNVEVGSTPSDRGGEQY